MRIPVLAAAALGLAIAGCASDTEPAGRPPAAAAARAGLSIETQYYTLPNGLKVVLSRDPSVPTATVGGLLRDRLPDRAEEPHRLRPSVRASDVPGLGQRAQGHVRQLIYNTGGVNNGSTRFDFTNYYEVVPSNALETVLWVEGDRMRGLVINPEALANQQGVVANEVKVNVLNQPYGGWPWIDMPMLANTNWHNSP